MAVDAAVQETIIPAAMVVAIPFLVVVTTVVFGSFCCFYSVAVTTTIVAAATAFSAETTTIAVTGSSGLSLSPASVAEITAANNSVILGGEKPPILNAYFWNT